jgi:CheY-like chemotaxis protein
MKDQYSKYSYQKISCMEKQFNRIFLIDDDSTFNFITKLLLNRVSFAAEIVDFIDAHEALNELRISADSDSTQLPDLIFLDLNMPGMDGWDFLDEYQTLPEKVQKECKLFILTSSIDPNDKSKSLTYSFVMDFISKPLAFAKVKSIMENN